VLPPFFKDVKREKERIFGEIFAGQNSARDTSPPLSKYNL